MAMTINTNIAALNAQRNLNRLKTFEKKHKMKSEAFFGAFQAGKLGDDAEWFDWLYVYEAYNRIIKQKKIIAGLSL